MTKKYKPYYIVWRDACFQEGQGSVDDLPQLSILRTVGFIVQQNKDRVTVAREHSSSQWYRGILAIPRENIVSITRLRKRGGKGK